MQVELYNTASVEGKRIVAYKGFIAVQQVAGAGFFKDFKASFTDFFGGNSGAYRESMQELQNNATRQLIQEAQRRGANAVVGVHIDFDSISGKDTSMFMASMQGTAVVLE